MDELIFCIATPDRAIMNRWQSAFRKAGWDSRSCDSLTTRCDCSAHAEMDLIEVCTQFCKTPEDLRAAIKMRKPVATLAFAEAGSVSNSQIAMFLECGADDFIYKGTDERVLVAKLKAHLRRLAPVISEASEKLASSDGEIEIDRSKRAVKIAGKAGKRTELSNLTQKELDILTMLVGNEQKVVSRERMLEKLWGNSATEVYSECIDKHIESLRRKLGMFGKKIRTVYGSGYMFLGTGKHP